MISFTRTPGLPLIRGGNINPGTWNAKHAADPSAVVFGGNILLYSRGDPGSGISAAGVWSIPATNIELGPQIWDQNPVANPILTAGGTFDTTGINDPCAIVYSGKVFLFYGAYTDTTSNVGLATSADGLTFAKVNGDGDINVGGGSPGAVVGQDGLIHLFVSGPYNGGYALYHIVANDETGQNFPHNGTLALAPTGNPGDFDQLSVNTPRLWYEAPYYYMTYCGGSMQDYPEGLGLVRSTDLVNWTRYGPPILMRGPSGEWDGGGVWAPSQVLLNGKRYLFYEGCGTGDHNPTSAATVSARTQSYGGYGVTSFSGVGVATDEWNNDLTNFEPDVGDLPPAAYSILNANSGRVLATDPAGPAARQYQGFGTAGSDWYLDRVNGFYRISNVAAGAPGTEVLQSAGAIDQAYVDVAPWMAAPAQQWLATRVGPAALGAGTFQLIKPGLGHGPKHPAGRDLRHS